MNFELSPEMLGDPDRFWNKVDKGKEIKNKWECDRR